MARMLFNKATVVLPAQVRTLFERYSNSFNPFYLANYCSSTQTAASTLENALSYLFTRRCNKRYFAGLERLPDGCAQLLYASGNTDTAFMLLNDATHRGLVCGLSANTVASGTSVVGLHHPSGDLLKISFGTINGQSNCQPTTAVVASSAVVRLVITTA